MDTALRLTTPQERCQSVQKMIIYIYIRIDKHTIIYMHINPMKGYSSEINNTSRKVSERSKDDNIHIY